MGFFLVPEGDEVEHRNSKFFDRAKASVAQALPLKDAEKQLDLIDPGSVLGGVMEAMSVAAVEFRPAAIGPVVMNIEIVPDDVNWAFGIAHGYFFHKTDELSGGSPVGALVEDLTRMNIEGAEKRLSAVPFVLELSTTGPTRSGRSIGKPALQSLHARLFIDAEHDLTGRWIQIQLSNLCDFLTKLRIGTVHLTQLPQFEKCDPLFSMI